MSIEWYRELIQRFLAGEMQAHQFKKRYLTAFRNESAGMPAAEFDVLAELYCMIDCFWPCTGEDQPQEEAPEEELRAEAARTLHRLLRFQACKEKTAGNPSPSTHEI